MNVRSERRRTLTIGGKSYRVKVVETPFREGVEVECSDFSPPLRISDRQLGEGEALRLLGEEIIKRIGAAPCGN